MWLAIVQTGFRQLGIPWYGLLVLAAMTAEGHFFLIASVALI